MKVRRWTFLRVNGSARRVTANRADVDHAIAELDERAPGGSQHNESAPAARGVRTA